MSIVSVQDLINELNKIEDKEQHVFIMCVPDGATCDIKEVKESKENGGVLIVEDE